jgi:hypothetical protein
MNLIVHGNVYRRALAVPRTLDDVYVMAYLFDIRNGKTRKLDVTTPRGNRGRATDLTRQLVIELFADG